MLICFLQDGSKVFTGGVSGEIFVSPGFEDTIDDFEPFTVGDEVLGFSISDEGRIFVAPKIEPGEEGCNEILAFKYDDTDGKIADGM